MWFSELDSGMKYFSRLPCLLAVLACCAASTGTAAKDPAQSRSTAKVTAAKPAATAVSPSSIRGVPVISRDPYLGMIAVDAATGAALIEDNPDVTVYPASVIKLMNLLVIMERVRQGSVHLNDPIEAQAEVTRMGGSQVYLKEHEVFTVDELIYALMVQSANDAAVALAIHVAGSQQAFVKLMNDKAQALGMTHTRFYSCHGLPPTPPRTPREVDASTPRDLAILAREIVTRYPEILAYTATQERPFRTGAKPFVMRNHNHLLHSVPGVDGLKTGYFTAAGYTTVITAKRNDRRVIVVVAASKGTLGKVRDQAAKEAINRAFTLLPPLPPPPPPPTNAVVRAEPDPTSVSPDAPPAGTSHSNGRVIGIVLGILIVGIVGVSGFFAWRSRKSDSLSRGGSSRRPGGIAPPLKR